MTAEFPTIPSEPLAYYQFAQGADAFYRGKPRPLHPSGNDQFFIPFDAIFPTPERDGWDWAERMTTLAAQHEARNASRH